MCDLENMIDCEKKENKWIKPIKGLEDYLITTNGAIWSKKRKKWLKTFINPVDGYLQITISRKNYRIHQLVAQTFIRDYDTQKEQTHHKNHIRSDCRLQNLQILSIPQHYEDELRAQRLSQKLIGRKRSQQVRKRISQGHKGLKQSPQTIKKRINTIKRNKYMKQYGEE